MKTRLAKHRIKLGRSNGGNLTSAQARFIAFAILVSAVFLMGGSSRPDVQSLVLLRPISVLLGGYALTIISYEQLQLVRIPLLLFLGFALLIGLQLAPLPPEIWAELPGRATVAEVSAVMGLGDAWRPLSLAPDRSINALLSLTVPAAALLLFAVQKEQQKQQALVLFLWAAIGSALLGALQIFGPSDGSLYIYRISTEGAPVGFFANRNHQSVFLACMVLFSIWFIASASKRDRGAPLRRAFGMAALLLCFVMVLIAGSRAGLAALAFTSAIGLGYARRRKLIPNQISIGRRKISRRAVFAGLTAFLLGLVGLSIAQGRALSIDRLVNGAGGVDGSDLRSELAPVLWRMIWNQFPYGSGYGSFEDFYGTVEPLNLLSKRYLNQAHNDWAQFVIEGGLAGLVLLGLMVAWLVWRMIQALRADPGPSRDLALLSLVVLAVLGFASAVDYPLRTPAMAVFGMTLAVIVEAWVQRRSGGVCR